MCSVMELAKAYRAEDHCLIEIEDCVKRILKYQAEIARMQFLTSVVLEVKESRRRQRKVLDALDEYGERMYQSVQQAVVRLNDLAVKKGLNKVLDLSEVISKESITAFCAGLAYELATGEFYTPLDPAPAGMLALVA